MFSNKFARRFADGSPLKHAVFVRNCAANSSSGTKGTREYPQNGWNYHEVVKWASRLRDVIDEDLDVLRNHRINGDTLLRASQQDLERWGMKGGPASQIIAALNPDTSLEYWHQLLKAIDTISQEKVDWNGDPADDPNLYVLTLPNDLHWPTLASPHLFIRSRCDCSDKIWTAIVEAYLKRARHQGPYVEFERALIQGNSGIGKTAFLNYALYRARKEGYPVLLETKDERVFIHGDKVESEDIVLMEKGLIHYRRDPNVLVLHDHIPGTEPPILTNGAFVIAPVSPDARNSKEFRKDRCLKRWMPLPSRQELEAMNSMELKISPEILDERIKLFGPITRYCLTTTEDFKSKEEELDSKLHFFRYEQLAPMIRSAKLPTIQEYGLTWLIIQIDTEDLIKPKVAWGTPDIRDKIATYAADNNLAELENFLAESISNPPPEETRPTKEYEVWAASKLARGMGLPVWCFPKDGVLEPTERLQFPFPKADVIQTDKALFNVSELIHDSPKIFRSRRKEPVLCDVAVVTKYPAADTKDTAKDTLVLIQATTGKKHDISMSRLKEYVDEAIRLEIQHVILVFIVPEMNCFKLEPAELKPALEYCRKVSKTEESRIDVSLAVAELKPRSQSVKSFPTNE